MKNQSQKILNYGILFFVIATVIVMHSSGEIHAQQPVSVKIDKGFSNSQVIFPFAKINRIYSLEINGSIQLYEDNSLIRVILVGDDFNEYLVYEAYPLIVDNNSETFINECEETCITEGIAPHSLKIELVDASLQIDELALIDYPLSLKMETAEAQKQIKEERDADKIKKLNESIKKEGLKWTAGETPISKLSYEEKKKLFGKDKVPNLQGAEYYKGGIFEIKSKVKSQTFTGEGISTLIESFDWRNRHGADNPGSPYYDGDPTGSGWITSVKNQGGYPTCWPFSATGATEALVNLYFNQHLDLDLAEQDVISCRGTGGTINFFSTTGVVDEACFPYSGPELPCENKCINPDELIQLNGHLDFVDPKTEEKLKRMIIDYGPLSGGIYSWNHAMVLPGYDKDQDDGKTIWIFKNSWGSSWGDNGYGYIKTDINDIGWTNAFLTPVESWITPYEIACNDFDGDGYYNWGITNVKPASCPTAASSIKDCDDNNPSLGPFNTDGHCVPIFEDVPPSYWAEDAIYKIFDAGITTGCSKYPLKYCPEDNVTRAQMAVFLGRVIHGSSFTPLPATGIFNDVPTWYWAADWIEQFYKDGITTGCSKNPLNYCPDADVTRAQMAIFLLRSKYGKSYKPPKATGIFTDVPVTYWAADWIEQLYREKITTGCKKKPLMYCPANHVTRAQMAVFLTRLLDQIGFVAYYPFNGNANDESGNGNHGTVYGAVLTMDRFGKANSAYSFDGVDDYIDVGNDPILNPTNDLTIAAWVKINSGESEGIVFGNANLHPDKGFSLAIKNSKIAGVFNRAPSDWTTFLGNSLIPSNTWSHLALVYSGLTAKLYLNASNEYSDNVARWTDNWENFKIGKEIQTHLADSVYDPFNGDIDEIRIYNRALSEVEIKALYNIGN